MNRLVAAFTDPLAHAYHPDLDDNAASVVAQLRADIDGQEQGVSALETLLKVIKGESFEKTVNIPFILITKDNVAEYQ